MQAIVCDNCERVIGEIENEGVYIWLKGKRYEVCSLVCAISLLNKKRRAIENERWGTLNEADRQRIKSLKIAMP